MVVSEDLRICPLTCKVCSGILPERYLSSVDLPAPFMPTSPTLSRSPIRNELSIKSSFVPIVRLRLRASSICLRSELKSKDKNPDACFQRKARLSVPACLANWESAAIKKKACGGIKSVAMLGKPTPQLASVAQATTVPCGKRYPKRATPSVKNRQRLRS